MDEDCFAALSGLIKAGKRVEKMDFVLRAQRLGRHALASNILASNRIKAPERES
jgi:hypothetical protein